MAELPQNIPTEGVNGGNRGLIDQGGLAAKPGVSRVRRQTPGNLPGHTPPKLGGGGPGEGDDQEPVDVQLLPDHPVQKPLHQHPRLAGAGGGGNQKLPAPVAHHSFLFLRQRKGHLTPPPFSHRPPRSRPASCSSWGGGGRLLPPPETGRPGRNHSRGRHFSAPHARMGRR